MQLATKTLEAISTQIKSDQGLKYRENLGKVIPHIGDAYDPKNFPFRSHLGASIIGHKCDREIWYGFHWSKIIKHEGQLLRLFNRGHLEEARFIAMLLAIGVQVYQQDSVGNQFRISDHGGHFGGSGDGILYGIPDLDPGVYCLGEFKTANDKSFNRIKTKGVEVEKYEHYVQMQIYMHKFKMVYALYMVVNKNNDELHAEIVNYNSEVAIQYLNRAGKIIYRDDPPPRISENPAWYECKFCDFYKICHQNTMHAKTCRTCVWGRAEEDGTWKCHNMSGPSKPLSKEEQLNGCCNWGFGKLNPEELNRPNIPRMSHRRSVFK